jgi:hypothetical protein
MKIDAKEDAVDLLTDNDWKYRARNDGRYERHLRAAKVQIIVNKQQPIGMDLPHASEIWCLSNSGDGRFDIGLCNCHF